MTKAEWASPNDVAGRPWYEFYLTVEFREFKPQPEFSADIELSVVIEDFTVTVSPSHGETT